MVVVAECSECEDRHPLGSREMGNDAITTICPGCGSTQYDSVDTIDPDDGEMADRISTVVSDIDGVGPKTTENIVEHFVSYRAFETADVSTLTQVDGVGTQTACSIRNALDPSVLETLESTGANS